MMISRLVKFPLVVLGALALHGCVTVRPPVFLRPPAEREWGHVLPAARAMLARGDYPGPDTLLASFIRRHPDSREAADAAFWLGIARLDPRNGNASAAGAVEAFEIHLSDREGRHRHESAALRRVAARVDSLQQDLASIAEVVRAAPPRPAPTEARPAPGPPPSVEDEVRRLRAELARANDELERIRRRLTAPPRP